MKMTLTTRWLTWLVIVEMQSLVLCYLDTTVHSSSAIGQVALIIVAFIFNIFLDQFPKLGYSIKDNTSKINSL